MQSVKAYISVNLGQSHEKYHKLTTFDYQF